MRRYALGLLVALVGLCTFPPVAVAETPWRFIAASDSSGSNNGVNSQILTELAARFVAEQPDLVVFSGDLIYGTSDTATLTSRLTNWRTIMQPVYNAGITVLAVRGNHEDVGSVAAWNAVFTGAYAMPGNGPAGEVNITYSLAHKNAFFAGLDHFSGHYHRVNQAWLDGQLAANTRSHVFVFGHEPAYKVVNEGCLDDYPADRDVFWSSLAGAGARTYICGHDHLYNRVRLDDGDGNPDDDLHQLSIGTAGASLYTFNGVYNGNNGAMTPVQQYYASQYGYVVFVVDGLHVTLTWMQRLGPNVYVPFETWSYTVAPRLGDLNCDGYFNTADILPFATAMTDPATYLSTYSGCDIAKADMNLDSVVNGRDVQYFAAALLAQ